MNKENKPFNEIFDQLFDKWLDEKEEDLRTLMEKMIGNFRMTAIKWKQKQYEKMKLNNIKDIQ